MIVKPSTKADECAAISAFIGTPDFDRLPERARKNALARRRGLEGERSTAHILDRHFHDAPNHALLHDLRLPDGIGGFAQFDHVILSRLSKTAAVVEVKNYRGRLSKNEHDEWLVWYEGRRRPRDIPNPLAQARRQKEVLRAWLKANHHDLAFDTIGAFVIIPPDCSIDRSKVRADVPIYKADNFIAAWTPFGGITPLGRLFSTGVSAKTLQTIASQLAGDHQPDRRSLDEMIGVRPETARSGAEQEVAATEVVDHTLHAGVGRTAAEGEDGIVESEVPASPLGIVSEPESPPALMPVANDPEPAPVIVAGKASDKVEIVPGIYERTLPDGRVAFLAGKDDGAGERLKLACQGIAQWNPRFRNWLTDGVRASTIRETIMTIHREQAGAAHGTG
jgi:hypothetical protein